MLDLLENECTSQSEGAEYESDINTLQFFIHNLNFGILVPKLKSCKGLLENLHTSQFEGHKNEYDSIALRFCI